MTDEILKALEIKSDEATIAYLEDSIMRESMEILRMTKQLENRGKMVEFMEAKVALCRHQLGPDHPLGEGIAVAT